MSNIKIYATEWCGDCRRTRNFFERYQIEYEWINIDKNKQAEEYVIEVNQGNRSVPTILLTDGSTLTEPSIQTLQKIFLIQ